MRDLATFLANSDETHAAFVEQLFHYLVKQPVRAYGLQTSPELQQAFVRNNFSIRREVVEIVTTAALTGRQRKPTSRRKELTNEFKETTNAPNGRQIAFVVSLNSLVNSFSPID